jgi:cyclopropane fatty-acyl-phospholipid synthase-like methyltransferase
MLASTQLHNLGCFDCHLFNHTAKSCRACSRSWRSYNQRNSARQSSLALRAVEFQVKDALTLGDWDQRFATVIDSGLFHVLSDEDRMRYISGLTHVTAPGGRLLLLCFSDEEPGTQGPRRVSQREIRAAFYQAWMVEEIRSRRADVRQDLEDVSFSEGGPKVWFIIIGRNS